MKAMQKDAGWSPLQTAPDNCVVSAWKKKGSSLICAEIHVDKNGEILGYLKGTGDSRVTGALTIKDLLTLEDAFEEMTHLLDAVSVKVPTRLRIVPEARGVSVG